MRSRPLIWVLIVLFVSVGLQIGIGRKGKAEVTDLLPLVRLQTGVTDTLVIGDLFYAEDYPLRLQASDAVDASYDKQSGRLILTPKPDFEGMVVLPMKLHGQRLDLPVLVRMVPEQTFRYSPGGHPDKVTLFGSFNSWNRHVLPLTDADGDGEYTVSLPLEAGRYEYRFWVDGVEATDPANPQKVPNPFGEFNSLLLVGPRHPDPAYLHLLDVEDGEEELTVRFALDHPQAADLSPEAVIALWDNRKLDASRVTVQNDRITLTVKSSDLAGTHRLRCAVTIGGQATPVQTIDLVDGHPAGGPDQPFEWADAVVYSIMIDRFADGDPSNTQPIAHPNLADAANYHGGDLQGIIDKIDQGYFEKLGVNTLWLFPVVDNPDRPFREFPEPHRWFTGYHGYWPVHPTQVEPRFGDMALFQSLVGKAHERGFKVLLDFVSNHVHQEHPFFKEHPEWFGQLNLPDGRQNIRFWDEYRLTTWFDTFLPSFDYLGSDEALEVMTDNAVWWMQTSGIDGFRQDAVKHVPNRFWRTLTRKVREQIEIPQGRETYQIGETFGGYDLISSYVNNGQLDAQFNFQIYDTGQYVFLTPGASFAVLDAEMQKTFDVYTMRHLMGNLMDSHDKVRFMAQADGDVPLGDPLATEKAWTDPPKVDHASSYQKAQLYLAFVLTIPGVPVLYYGDEIGLTGAADPDNRRPMRFGEDLSNLERRMLTGVTRLVHLRRDHSALRHGDFVTLKAEDDLYAYLRSDAAERVLVVLNKGEVPQKVDLNLPACYELRQAEDLLNDGTVQIENNRLSLQVPAWGMAVFQVQ